MSTKSSLREQFEFLAQTPVVFPVRSGSFITIRLEVPSGHRVPLRIEIVRIMSRAGLRPRDGKPALDELLRACQVTVTLPALHDLPALISEFAKADVTATVVEPALAN